MVILYIIESRKERPPVNTMKRLLKVIREPIVIFFVLGILDFLLYERSTGNIESNNKEIHVNQSQIANLEETFSKTWNRPA